MILKAKYALRGEHVHASLYCGPEVGNLAHVGSTAMRQSEWDHFITTLAAGSGLPYPGEVPGFEKVVLVNEAGQVTEVCRG